MSTSNPVPVRPSVEFTPLATWSSSSTFLTSPSDESSHFPPTASSSESPSSLAARPRVKPPRRKSLTQDTSSGNPGGSRRRLLVAENVENGDESRQLPSVEWMGGMRRTVSAKGKEREWCGSLGLDTSAPPAVGHASDSQSRASRWSSPFVPALPSDDSMASGKGSDRSSPLTRRSGPSLSPTKRAHSKARSPRPLTIADPSSGLPSSSSSSGRSFAPSFSRQHSGGHPVPPLLASSSISNSTTAQFVSRRSVRARCNSISVPSPAQRDPAVAGSLPATDLAAHNPSTIPSSSVQSSARASSAALLPHFSLDSKFSLPPTSTPIPIDRLRFDEFSPSLQRSLGEALSCAKATLSKPSSHEPSVSSSRDGSGGAGGGTGTERTTLPDNPEPTSGIINLSGKGVRKASIGMGLFKESSVGSKEKEKEKEKKERDKIRDTDQSRGHIQPPVFEEDEDSASAAATGLFPAPPTTSGTTTSAAAQNPSSPRQERHHFRRPTVTPRASSEKRRSLLAGSPDLVPSRGTTPPPLRTSTLSSHQQAIFTSATAFNDLAISNPSSPTIPGSPGLFFTTESEDSDEWTTSEEASLASDSATSSLGLYHPASTSLERPTHFGRASGSDDGGSATEDEMMDESDDRLPTVPLLPFQNQVGGHSAIYKFTKRAVCKPLVSHENIFYEAVEREAPELLSFIPRYLGILVVTCRRQPRSASLSPAPQEHDAFPENSLSSSLNPSGGGSLLARPRPFKIATASGRLVTPPPMPEEEVLEVALDRNRHVVPEWLLRRDGSGSRNGGSGGGVGGGLSNKPSDDERSSLGGGPRRGRQRAPKSEQILSHVYPRDPSLSSTGTSAQQRISSADDSDYFTTSPSASSHPHHSAQPIPFSPSGSYEERPFSRGGAGASARPLSSRPRDFASACSESPPNFAPPTPASSPLQFPHSPLQHATSFPSLAQAACRQSQHHLRDFPSHQEHLSKNGGGGGPGVGGVGATTVNTKLRDYVFGTIARQWKKERPKHHSMLSWSPSASTADFSGSLTPTDHRLDPPAPPSTPSSSLTTSKRLGHIRRVHSEAGIQFPPVSPCLRSSASARASPSLVASRLQSVVTKNSINGSDAEEEVDEADDPMFAMDDDDHHLGDDERGDHDQPENDTEPESPMLQTHLQLPYVATTPAMDDADPVASPRISMLRPAEVDEDVRQMNFILMEDLTGRLKRPCVLDLKMGTRQHGYDATPAKAISQRKKCDKTTSRALGARICGMQVWNSQTEEFISQNKLIGRQIKVSEFNDQLARFISDGDRLLVYHIPTILRKLWRLASILHKLPSYRFYGCSLLFIYDGDARTQEALRVASEDLPSSLVHVPSQNSTSSQQTLIHPRHHDHHQDVPEPTRSRRDSQTYPERRSRSADATQQAMSLSGLGGHSHLSRSGHPPHASLPSRGEVKIRIVDFAHTTTGKDYLPLDPKDDLPAEELGKGYNVKFDPETGKALARFPPAHPERPDEGFIFGIQQLCRALEAIWEAERLRRRKAAAASAATAAAAAATAAGAEGVVAAEGSEAQGKDKTLPSPLVQLPKLDLSEGERVWRKVVRPEWQEDPAGYLSS